MTHEDNPLWTYQATVQRVVDADTLDLRIDLGFDTHKTARVRLAEYDAPDIHNVSHDSEEYERGVEQADFVAEWVNEVRHEGRWPFTVRTHKSGKFGRWLGVIHRKGDDVSLAEALEAEFGGDA